MNLSHSTITELLDGCAYRSGLRSIVKLPSPQNGRLALGTAFHSGVEAHEAQRILYRLSKGKKGSWEGLPLPVMVALSIQLLEESDVDWETDDLTIEQAIEGVESCLTNWWAAPIPEGNPGAGESLRDRVMKWEPIQQEQRWKLWVPPLSSLPVVGFLDAVYLTPEGNLVAVDYKSAGNFNKWKLDGNSNRDQGALYVLAMLQSPHFPIKGTAKPLFENHVVRTTVGKTKKFEGARLVPIDVDEIDLEYIRSRIAQAHKVQLEGRWEKNPKSFFCSAKWCPYHKDAGGECDPLGPNEYDVNSYR